MFREFSRPSSGAQRLQWQPLVLPSYRGDSRAVVRGRAGRPALQDNKLKNCCIWLVIYLNYTQLCVWSKEETFHSVLGSIFVNTGLNLSNFCVYVFVTLQHQVLTV